MNDLNNSELNFGEKHDGKLRPGMKLAYSEKELLKELPVSSKTLYNLRHSEVDPLPFINLNARVLYPVAEVHKWWNAKLKKKGVA